MDLATEYQTLKVRYQEPIVTIQFYRPEANNTINARFIEECQDAVRRYQDKATVMVFEGLADVFCYGADFQGMQNEGTQSPQETGPELLYDLWKTMATGPFISISHVRGKANAGGMGFVAASDIVLADETAQFSLSELLFGLMPACVLPFLIRRIGFQKANYLTLMTQPITVQQALAFGLVDAYEAQSEMLLRRHLLRLRRLSKKAIGRYKRYASSIVSLLDIAKPHALEANRQVFQDQENMMAIARYVKTGQFPWEQGEL